MLTVGPPLISQCSIRKAALNPTPMQPTGGDLRSARQQPNEIASKYRKETECTRFHEHTREHPLGAAGAQHGSSKGATRTPPYFLPFSFHYFFSSFFLSFLYALAHLTRDAGGCHPKTPTDPDCATEKHAHTIYKLSNAHAATRQEGRIWRMPPSALRWTYGRRARRCHQAHRRCTKIERAANHSTQIRNRGDAERNPDQARSRRESANAHAATRQEGRTGHSPSSSPPQPCGR